jgi:hypothetical protein
MTLAKNDHIYVGIGHIYCPPFLGRVLLYRLFECDCAVLIYHRELGSVSNVFAFGRVQAVAASGGSEPNQLMVHFSFASASVDLKDLLALPATQLALPEDGATASRFGDVNLRVERFSLPFTQRLIVAYACLPRRELRISGTDFQVAGRMDVSLWPNTVRSNTLERRCWKLSLCDVRRSISYDLESVSNWSLTALDIEMEPGFQATHEITLRKVAA